MSEGEASENDSGDITACFSGEDYGKYLDEVNETDDLSPPQQSMITRLKVARQKGINKKVEEHLSEAEKVKEKM